jgi:cold shock CspA family protein
MKFHRLFICFGGFAESKLQYAVFAMNRCCNMGLLMALVPSAYGTTHLRQIFGFQHMGLVHAAGHAPGGHVVCCDGVCKFVKAQPAHEQHWVADAHTLSGTCKWFSRSKGYGFIRVNVDGESVRDLFVHQSDLCSGGMCVALIPGEALEFRVSKSLMNGKEKAAHISGPGGSPLQGMAYNDDSDESWSALFEQVTGIIIPR